MQAKPLATGEDDRASRWLSLCGVMAPPILIVFIIVAAFVTPGYSHISETVSQLGAQGRPHPEVMNAGFIIRPTGQWLCVRSISTAWTE